MDPKVTAFHGYHLREGVTIEVRHVVADHLLHGYPVLNIGEAPLDAMSITIWPTKAGVIALAAACAAYLTEHDEHAAYELEAVLARHRERRAAERRPIPAEAATAIEKSGEYIGPCLDPGCDGELAEAADGCDCEECGAHYTEEALEEAHRGCDHGADCRVIRRRRKRQEAAMAIEEARSADCLDAGDLFEAMASSYEVRRTGATNCPGEVP